MPPLRITLISDGSSDSTLLEIIRWLLADIYPTVAIQGNFADFRRLLKPPKAGDVADQIDRAKKYYPFDILFYHRDAESRDKGIIQRRKKEVLGRVNEGEMVVCVVPVEMMEAWLLIDGDAIKKAAGNRNYNGPLVLPSIQKIERLSDPKNMLHELLKKASGLSGRRLDKFNVHEAVHLVAEYITDFSPLRQLAAFQEFEEDLKQAVNKIIGGDNYI